uniref:Ku domain-containing protein n=1 Tax=Rhodnius prolixus TaxID=13249 RepID=T1I325_RHOPR
MEGVILDDIDEEEDNSWNNQISGRNCVVFLIDSRTEMFKKTKGTSYFLQSLICCRDAMLDIARKQKGDMVGVLLYGTKISEGKYAPDNVAILQDLTVPSISVIKSFIEIIKDEYKQLRDKYGDVKEADLTRAINYCQIVIHLSKKKLHMKNIVMMTCDDNPCGDNEVAAFRARKQASELFQHQIDFDVISFGEQFDSSKLFKELVLTSRGELLKDWKNKDPIMKIEDLRNQIEKEPRKFLTTVKTESPSKKSVNPATIQNDELMNDEDDALFLQEEVLARVKEHEERQSTSAQQQVQPSDIETTNKPSGRDAVDESQMEVAYYPYIGEKCINITKSELKKRILPQKLNIRRGFQLLGFVPTVDVPLFLSIGEPYFVLPYGRDKNNRTAFSHLLHKCHDRGVSMLGWFCLTKSSPVSLTFLHPLHRSTDGKGHPDGFLLVKIPFADELFNVDEEECKINHQASEEQLNAAKQIISKVTLPYVVDMFNDSEFNARTTMIEALAMDYENVPETEDNTDIDLEDIATILGDLSGIFTGVEDPEETSVKAGSKRPAPDRRETSKERKYSDIVAMIQNGQVFFFIFHL